MGAVEAALELHDLVAPAEGARHAEREERRLRPARRVPHLLGARDRPHHLLRQLDRGLVEQHVRRAAPYLALDRLDDGGMGVAEEHRAGAEEVVEVASAVHVPEVGAAAFLHDELEASAAPVIAEQATRERVCGASQEVVLIGHDERTSLGPAADCATGLGGTEPRRTHGTPPTERSGLAAPAPTSTGLAAPAPTSTGLAAPAPTSTGLAAPAPTSTGLAAPAPTVRRSYSRIRLGQEHSRA